MQQKPWHILSRSTLFAIRLKQSSEKEIPYYLERTSDSLDERLPIKLAREKFQRKRYFFHENEIRFFPQIIRKSVFLIGQVPIKKIWVENSVFELILN